MQTFIGMQCIAANALIQLSKNGIREISFSKLKDFGSLVVEQYNKENHTEAILIFNPADIQEMVLSYPEYFDMKEKDQKYLCLKDNVDIRKLKEQFRWPLSYAMLKVFNHTSIEQLLCIRNAL